MLGAVVRALGARADKVAAGAGAALGVEIVAAAAALVTGRAGQAARTRAEAVGNRHLLAKVLPLDVVGLAGRHRAAVVVAFAAHDLGRLRARRRQRVARRPEAVVLVGRTVLVGNAAVRFGLGVARASRRALCELAIGHHARAADVRALRVARAAAGNRKVRDLARRRVADVVRARVTVVDMDVDKLAVAFAAVGNDTLVVARGAVVLGVAAHVVWQRAQRRNRRRCRRRLRLRAG